MESRMTFRTPPAIIACMARFELPSHRKIELAALEKKIMILLKKVALAIF